MSGYAMKIGYRTVNGSESRAYTDDDFPLEWEPTDGLTITATDKHTDEPVTVRWTEDEFGDGEWIAVGMPTS